MHILRDGGCNVYVKGFVKTITGRTRICTRENNRSDRKILHLTTCAETEHLLRKEQVD